MRTLRRVFSTPAIARRSFATVPPPPQISEKPIEDEEMKNLLRRWQDHEARIERVGDKVLHWNYRSEIQQETKEDHKHYYLWASFVALTLIGVWAFLAVKMGVIEERKREMTERDKQRQRLALEQRSSNSP